MSFTAEVLADSPLAYYRLGEASGATAADSSGHSLPGSYVGTVGYGAAGLVSGDSDTAISFASPGNEANHILSSSNVSLAGLTSYTVLIAVKGADLTARDGVFIWCDTSGQTALQIRNTGDYLQVNSNGASGTTPTGLGITNSSQPVLIHVTADASNCRTYVNSSLQLTFAMGATANQAPWYIARNKTSGFPPFDGTLDEWAIFGSALSQARITAQYNAFAGITPSVRHRRPVQHAALQRAHRW